MKRRDQTALVRAELTRGLLCGKWAYRNALPNARARAGEEARRLGMDLASDLCAHRAPGDPSYHDYALAPRRPAQMELPLAVAS